MIIMKATIMIMISRLPRSDTCTAVKLVFLLVTSEKRWKLTRLKGQRDDHCQQLCELVSSIHGRIKVLGNGTGIPSVVKYWLYLCIYLTTELPNALYLAIYSPTNIRTYHLFISLSINLVICIYFPFYVHICWPISLSISLSTCWAFLSWFKYPSICCSFLVIFADQQKIHPSRNFSTSRNDLLRHQWNNTDTMDNSLR